jgi:hypothetical protein
MPVKPNKAKTNAAIKEAIIHPIMILILKIINFRLFFSMIVPLGKTATQFLDNLQKILISLYIISEIETLKIIIKIKTTGAGAAML